MNRQEALKLDREYSKTYNENPFYADVDDNGISYIFGLRSGFAYCSPSNIDKEVERMWKEI